MRLQEIPPYEGVEDSCHYCGRKFEEGEIITVNQEGEPFCYTNSKNGGCLIIYTAKTGKTQIGKPRKFRDRKNITNQNNNKAKR